MVSEKTAMDYSFALMLLAQEIPFGLEPNFSEEAKKYADIPVTELNEEQARVLIDDMTAQRNAFFDAEGKRLSKEEDQRFCLAVNATMPRKVLDGDESN